MLLPFAGCSKKDELRVGTGSAGGTYYAYGTELTQAIGSNESTIKFKVCETAGSAANIRLIDDGYLQLAFTQSDMLWNASNGTGSFDEKHTGFSAVAGLYTEACQIVVPASSEIRSVSDLYGKRVSLGEDESGVLQNAKQILFAYGIDENMVDAQYLSFSASAEAVKMGSLDAFFCTAGVPTPAVSELAKEIPVRLIPVEPDKVERIIEQYGGYTNCTVEAGSYNGQDEDAVTLGVKNVLVASNTLSEPVVEEITQKVLEYMDSSGKEGLEFATSDIPIGFHKGAAKYYARQGVDVDENTAEPGQRQYAPAEGG